MCKFCEPKNYEKEKFNRWANVNPYKGDDQVSYEGIDFILDGKRFVIACNFDGGYIGDSIKIEFNYCPICGKKI